MPSTFDIPEISPEELIHTIEDGGDMQVLDIRAPHRLASGQIDLLPEDRFFNMAGPEIMALESVSDIGIAKNRPVAVVCDRGNSSKTITHYLAERGFDARSVVGGMAAWMMSGYPRDLKAPSPVDQLVQFDRVGKGSLAYLLVSNNEAILIDPARNLQPYHDRAAELGATIVAVADTHVHADYISGAPALAAQLQVPYYLHPSDNVNVYEGTPGTLDISPVTDGGTIEFGRCSLEVTHTPGHTEGSVTYLLGDEAAFTGDFIFVKSIGRPDLGGSIASWTGALWRSVQHAKEHFPGSITIYPAHYSSDAERNADRSIGTTFETIQADSEPLQISTEQEFASWVQKHAGVFPEAYKKIKVINAGLIEVSAEEADQLEVGKNECALA